MTSVWKNLGVLLLFLNASPLLRTRLLAQAVPTSPPVTRPRILFVTAVGADDEDYTDDSETHDYPPIVAVSAKPPLLFHEPKLCQHNPCLENQEPCAQLSARTDCLCPGLSGSDTPPHAPLLKEIVPVSSGKVEIQWCAPSSVITGYRVVVEGKESEALEFGTALRRGLVGYLEVGTKVCVEAVNDAGHSSPSEFSCQRYEAPKSSDNSMLAWVIGGGLALLLLICIAAAIFWKNKLCLRTKSTSDNAGGDPTYNQDGNL